MPHGGRTFEIEFDFIDHAVLEFLESTYESGAELAGWDRAALERKPG